MIMITIILMIRITVMIVLIKRVPARARCACSKSELARQTCSEQVDRGDLIGTNSDQCILKHPVLLLP